MTSAPHSGDHDISATELAYRILQGLEQGAEGVVDTSNSIHEIHRSHTSHIGGSLLGDGERLKDAEVNASTFDHSAMQEANSISGNPLGTSANSSTPNPPRYRASHTPPLHHTTPVAANQVVDFARRENIVRQIYADKLKASVQAIISALIKELPRDHLFMQLMDDPSTAQYCKVRLGEVVENYLFSSQAHQYHNLASELAKREVDVVALERDIEHLQHELAKWVAGTRSKLDTDVLATTSAEIMGLGASPPYKNASATSTMMKSDLSGSAFNPMSVEEAQQELVSILGGATSVSELERCKQGVSVAAGLAELTHSEGRYENKFEYISDVLAHLYRGLDGLIRYAYDSLESMDSLRSELVIAPHSESANLLRAVIAEKERLKSLFSSLQESQTQSQRVLERLSRYDLERETDLGNLATSLQMVKDQLEKASSASNLKAESDAVLISAKADFERYRDSIQRSMEEEREVARQLVSQLTEEKFALQERFVKAEGALASAMNTLALERQAAAQLSSQFQSVTLEYQKLRELHVNRVEHPEEPLKGAGSSLTDGKVETEAPDANAQAELLCHRIETTMLNLENLFLQNAVEKGKLMESFGYHSFLKQQNLVSLSYQETERHMQARVELANNALEEKNHLCQQAAQELQSLLLCIWDEEKNVEASISRQEDAEDDAYTRVVDREKEENAHSSGEKSLKMKYTISSNPQGNSVIVGNQRKDERGDTVSDNRDPRVPTTISSLIVALNYTFKGLQSKLSQERKSSFATKLKLEKLQSEFASLSSSESSLRQRLAEVNAREENLKKELDSLVEDNPIRELLARQSGLLKSLSCERDELRSQWKRLNSDYYSLEKRNGELHERCAVKEHENSKLVGLLRSLNASQSTSTSPEK